MAKVKGLMLPLKEAEKVMEIVTYYKSRGNTYARMRPGSLKSKRRRHSVERQI